jgi:hypothetical protein
MRSGHAHILARRSVDSRLRLARAAIVANSIGTVPKGSPTAPHSLGSAS